MRIASVCTSDRGGGAERSAWLHFDGYRERGHDSWLVVGAKQSDDERVITQFQSPFVDYRPYGRASFRAALGVARRVDRALGLEDFRHPYTRHLLDLMGAPPDVLHLHNLHGGFFDLRVIPALSARVPVFLSVHDLWALTGHCAHAKACTRWKNGCGSCPDLGAQPAVERDATRFNFRRKASIWKGSRLRVLVPCDWMKRQLEGSILESSIEELRVIRTPVDLTAFEPGDQTAARRELGIPLDAEIVLSVANLGLSSPLKDGATARAALERLAAHRGRRDLRLLVVGGNGADEAGQGFRIQHCDYIADSTKLALYYRAADVLLHASHAELLPVVLTEALACVLPVVAAAVGGTEELVRNGETGHTFAAGDAEAAARALAWSLDHADEARAQAVRGRRLVREEYDRKQVVDRTLAWFEEAVATDAGRDARALGPIVHYGLRGATVDRAAQAIRKRTILFKIARRLDHAPRFALYQAGRALRWAGLAPRLGQLVHHAPRELDIPESYRRTPEPLAQPPVISVVTPSLDQGRFLARTLSSVLDQGYPAVEYIVRDGGSTDGTGSVLAAFASRLHSVHSARDEGQTPALNEGFARTSGDIMAWLNADDLLLPGALDYVARYFLANPDVDVVYGHRILIDADDREIGRWIVPEHDNTALRWADFIPQETLFWRRRAWEKVGGQLDESFRFAMDWDLLLRFARADLRMVRLPRFLGGFRVHADQKTTAWVDVGIAEMDRLRMRELGFMPRPMQIHRTLWRYYLRHLRLHASYRLGLSRF